MCKIVVHVADSGDHPTNDAVNAGRFKPGEIIGIFPDSHVFGTLDLGDHNRLIRLPFIQADELEHLVGSDLPQHLASEIHKRLRIWRLKDHAIVPAMFKGTTADFLALIEMKPEAPKR